MATITSVNDGPAPPGLNDYKFGYEAWEVWRLLIERRRTTPVGRDEFTGQDHNGVPGYVWTGSMKSAIEMKYKERSGAQYFRNSVAGWLTSTGNAVNIGTAGIGAKWWFPAEWSNIRPDTYQRAVRSAGAATPRPARSSAPAGLTARQALDSRETPGIHPCHYCSHPPFADPHSRYKHERKEHPQQFLEKAEYLCPLETPSGECGYPAIDLNGFSKHLRFTHSLTSPPERRTVANAGRERARQAREALAAGELTDAVAQVADAPEPPAPAVPPVPAAAPAVALRAEAAPSGPMFRPPTPPPLARPQPHQHAPHHVPAKLVIEDGRITVAAASQAHDLLGAFLAQGTGDTAEVERLRGELQEERRAREVLRSKHEALLAKLGPLLELATT
jgi:hypothetical protein